MSTWAMREREKFITERLRAGGTITRKDLVEKFYITKTTASGDLQRYLAAHPDRMRYDGHRKAYVRADLAPPRGRTNLEAELLAQLKTAKGHIAHMAAWISQKNTGYSFEALGEDMPGIDAAIARAEGR